MTSLNDVQAIVVDEEFQPNEAYADKLRAVVPKVYLIGDAYNPGDLTDLVEKAAEIVVNL